MKRKLRWLLPILFVCVVGAQTRTQETPIPSYEDLKFPPLGQVEIPEVATFSFPNGMKLYLLEDHELPLVSGFALVRTGNLFDPPDKIGLAEITGMVMRTGGTTEKTGDELDEQLENMAASVESSIGETSGRVSFSALRENSREVLQVFRDLLTGPEFREDKIDLAKTQWRSAISRRNDEASDIASREFLETVYGKNTPYGWRIEYEHLDRIQREDLLAFYRRYFFPSNIVLAVYGDFSSEEMKADLEELFGDWQQQQPAVPAFPGVTAKPSPGTYVATKDDVTQTFFYLGHLGGVLSDADYPALEVMADILGGGFQSRLFQRVRTKLGYAYSVGARWGANYNHPGVFQISGSTKAASTTDALRVINEEVEGIRSSEVTDRELETAKQTVLNSFVFNFDTPGKTLSRMIAYEYYGYPKDFIFQYQKAVAAVTKKDILRVAAEHLQPKNMTVVAVGRPQDFDEPLSVLDLPVHDIDLTIPEPPRAATQQSEASIERGRLAMARIQKAVGGAERLAGVRDITQMAIVAIQTGSGALKADQTNRWLQPSYFRQDVDLPFGKTTTYFNGTEGWLSGPQGDGPLPDAVLKQAQGEVFRSYFRLLLSDQNPARTVALVNAGVLEISDESENRVHLWFDEKTGLPVGQTYEMAPGGTVEERYGDWKEVDGIQVPHSVKILRGGQMFGEIAVQQITLNDGLTVEELSKKP